MKVFYVGKKDNKLQNGFLKESLYVNVELYCHGLVYE